MKRSNKSLASKVEGLTREALPAVAALQSRFKTLYHRLSGRCLDLACEESGQGLVEYVLVFALISLGAMTGMLSLATAVNDAATRVFNIVRQTI